MVIYLFQKHSFISDTASKPCGLSYVMEVTRFAIGGDNNDSKSN